MSDILDKVPDWLKSLHHMENELRRSARHGLIFRWKEACEHLSEARGHLEQAMREAKGEEPADGPYLPTYPRYSKAQDGGRQSRGMGIFVAGFRYVVSCGLSALW